jgi:hypothetical protein
MSTNQENNRGVHLTIAAPAAANGGVGPNSGDPLMFGRGTSPGFALACVAETSYTEPSGLVPTGNISVNLEGVFFLAVIPTSAKVGGSNTNIKPGDRVYADTDGTYDSVTGCYYGFSLTANSSAGIHFGNSQDVLAGASTPSTIRVRLKVGG